MYANKPNTLELAALMLQFGLRHIVICPGSRNVPLSQTFATNKAFQCYSITDERSAAFFALGLTQSLREPVAVCCTSGSALLNILPAVSEAYYQQLPLLVISADRPMEWIGQMDGQTLPQQNIANVLFKKSVHLPEVKDSSEQWYCNRLINEALLELTHRTSGPVHINVPLSEPLFDFSVSELPLVRKITRYDGNTDIFTLSADLKSEWNDAKCPMVIVGQQFYSEEINLALGKLRAEKKCLIISELIGNVKYFEGLATNFDSVLHSYRDSEELKPDLVIYLGGHLVSKRLKAFLKSNNPKHLWMVNPLGEVIDTFKCLTSIIETNTLPFLKALINTDKIFEEDFLKRWLVASVKIEERSMVYPFVHFSDLYVLKETLQRLPECTLQLGNSSIIRNAQLFSKTKAKEVFCNRGTSGIEGSMSTAVGFATGSKELTYLVIGDLSFFYDMNALWTQYLSESLRILLINNGNGQIFNTLPNLNKSEIRSKYIAAEHKASAKAWVEDRGCQYLSASNKNELQSALSIFCSEEQMKSPLVLEVFTNAELSEEDFKAYYKYLNIK